MELRQRVREGLKRLHLFLGADTGDDVAREAADDEGLVFWQSETLTTKAMIEAKVLPL